MVDKLRLALRLLRSRSYVLITDEQATVCIPMVDVEKVENALVIGAQAAALEDFKTRLEVAIHEHKDAVTLLAYRSRQSDKSKDETVQVKRKGSQKGN